MTVDRPMDRHLKTGIAGAALTIIGILASGPLALLVVEGVHPQPAWTGAEAFARAFHPVQTLPYYAGFILVAGCIILMSALCRIAGKEAGARYLVSLVFTTIFATLIFFNYITQTTLVPALACHYEPANAPLISLFSLSNPSSLSWAIEMWGWSFFGAATWIASPVFRGTVTGNTAYWLMVLNGIISIAGAVMTSIDIGWVMTIPGLFCFVLWNLLVIVMSVFLILSMRGRLRSPPEGERKGGTR